MLERGNNAGPNMLTSGDRIDEHRNLLDSITTLALIWRNVACRSNNEIFYHGSTLNGVAILTFRNVHYDALEVVPVLELEATISELDVFGVSFPDQPDPSNPILYAAHSIE